jgi:hypothetical protein
VAKNQSYIDMSCVDENKTMAGLCCNPLHNSSTELYSYPYYHLSEDI